jgi:hypothetical protein
MKCTAFQIRCITHHTWLPHALQLHWIQRNEHGVVYIMESHAAMPRAARLTRGLGVINNICRISTLALS